MIPNFKSNMRKYFEFDTIEGDFWIKYRAIAAF